MSAINSTMMDLASIPLPSLTRLEQLPAIPATFEQVEHVLNSIYPYAFAAAASVASGFQSLSQHLSWSTAFNIIFVAFLVLNFKALPLIYHLRVLNAMRHMLKCMRPDKPITPEQLFQPLITSNRSPLLEIDVFGHKNNNTYFTDHDIARTHLLSTLFARGIEKIRGSVTMNGLSGAKKSNFTIPLGAVCASFRKELKPYESYDMWTRVLSWDEKWLYIVTHFVKKGAKIEPEEIALYSRQNSISGSAGPSRQNSVVSLSTPRGSLESRSSSIANNAIAASAMSKVVFKDGRITIAPEVMLEASGLLPSKDTTKDHDKHASAQLRANSVDVEVSPLDAIHELEKLEGSESGSDSGRNSPGMGSLDDSTTELTREDIEVERIRGLRLAKMLASQVDLEHELRNEIALGRHSDGIGLSGVIATLLQLGKVSNYQLL